MGRIEQQACRAAGGMKLCAMCRTLLVVACALLVALALSSCRVSDALTEVIYDQTADIIDYENPTKIFINDSTAEVESDEFAAKEVRDDTDVVSSTVQNLVVYSSKPNTEGFTAKKSVFSATPDFRGIEASEEVCFVKSDDPEAFDHPLTIEEPEDEPEQEDEPEKDPIIIAATTPQETTETSPSNTPSTATPTTSGTNESTDDFEDIDSSGDGFSDIQEGDSQGDASTDDQQNPTSEETDDGGGNDNGDVEVAYDASDPTAEPRKVTTMAAFGQAAVIVQMIGGTGALAATDTETLSGDFARIFDTSNIYNAWSDDGTDASTMNIDAIIESGADTVLVYSGDYFTQSLSKADIKRLNKEGITQTVIYPMTNSGNIKRDVNVVAEMLAESPDIQYAGQTANRAASYTAFHDRVVQSAANANNGLAGTTVFETGKDSSAPSLTSNLSFTYTLLADEYEEAAYTGPTANGWKPEGGLLFASAGYNTTPVSYYIQAGGLVNNAADKTSKSATGKIVAWQFHTNNFPFRKSEWSGTTVKQAKTPDGYSLLTTTNNLHGIYPFGESFGSASFPKIIVTSPDIKSQLISNSQNPSGTYHPYDFSSNGIISMMGPDPALPACIGFNGADSSQARQLPSARCCATEKRAGRTQPKSSSSSSETAPCNSSTAGRLTSVARASSLAIVSLRPIDTLRFSCVERMKNHSTVKARTATADVARL